MQGPKFGLHDFGGDLLFDAGNKMAEACDIAMRVPDDTRRPEAEETLAVLRPDAVTPKP
jgi:hypothetical protein